jgi:hypothetical protein
MFKDAWIKSGKKLDMGKACVRFKKLEDLPLDVIGQTIKRLPAKNWITFYQKSLASMGKSKSKPKSKPAVSKSKARSAAKSKRG